MNSHSYTFPLLNVKWIFVNESSSLQIWFAWKFTPYFLFCFHSLKPLRENCPLPWCHIWVLLHHAAICVCGGVGVCGCGCGVFRQSVLRKLILLTEGFLFIFIFINFFIFEILESFETADFFFQLYTVFYSHWWEFMWKLLFYFILQWFWVFRGNVLLGWQISA